MSQLQGFCPANQIDKVAGSFVLAGFWPVTDARVIVSPKLDVTIADVLRFHAGIVADEPGFDEWGGREVLFIGNRWRNEGLVIELLTARFQFAAIFVPSAASAPVFLAVNKSNDRGDPRENDENRANAAPSEEPAKKAQQRAAFPNRGLDRVSHSTMPLRLGVQFRCGVAARKPPAKHPIRWLGD